MSSQKPKSLQDRLKEQRKEEFREVFVGRGEEVASFLKNLAQPPEKRLHFLFNPYGQGGVGKTFLLRRLQQLVDEQEALSAWSNAGQHNIVEVMAQISEELRLKDSPLKSFDERYRTYRQKRMELEADAEVPAGFYEFVGRTVAKAGLTLGAHALGAGALLPLLNADELSAKMGEALAFVARKLKKDDVQLVQEPITVLTPLWLNDLRQVCERHPVVLFFDAYERTAGFLDEWLRDVLLGRYGETSLRMLVAVAGQVPLPRESWEECEAIISRMPLEPFTEDETRSFLNRRGLVDAQQAADIFHKTKGLPVLVALVAANPTQPFDPHDTVAEHFLKGVESSYRQVALDAALPRRLNRDVLAELAGPENADAFFGRLRQLPFVQQRVDGWEYHAVVRHLMLSCKLRESPEGWSGLHRKLGGYYERLQRSLELPESRQLQDPVWREHALELLYHRMCESPHRFSSFALGGFLSALKFQRDFAGDWAETLQQAEEDTQGRAALRWGTRLRTALEAIEEGRFAEAVGVFTALLEREDLGRVERAVGLNWRGYLHRQVGQLEDALKDASAAIELAPEEGEYLADRGRVLFLLRRYDEALLDFDRAVMHIPDGSLYAMRAFLFMSLNRYDEAQADVNRAVALDPTSMMPSFLRLFVALRRGDSVQAAAASASVSSQALQFVSELRELFQEMPMEVAVAQLQSLLPHLLPPMEVEPERTRQQLSQLLARTHSNPESMVDMLQAGAASFQSFVHRQQGELEKALASISQAIEHGRGEAQYWLTRAEIRQQIGCHEESLADFTQAAVLAPGSAEVFSKRAGLLWSRGRTTEALADYSRALELSPTDAMVWVQRSALHRGEGRLQEALADLERAVALWPDNILLVFHRLPLQAALHDSAGMVDTYGQFAAKALQAVQQLKAHVVNADPQQQLENVRNWLLSVGFNPVANPALVERWNTIVEGTVDDGARSIQSDSASLRAFFYNEKAEYTEALAALTQALDLDPKYPYHWTARAGVYRAMGRYEEALSDLSQAIALKPNAADIHLALGQLYLQMNRIEDALAALERALALDSGLVQARILRSTALRHKEQYEDALSELGRVLEQHPDHLHALSLRSTVYALQERYEEALKDVEDFGARAPSSIKHWKHMRGELLSRLGRYDEALVVYQQVLEEEPGSWRAYYNLAITRACLEGPVAVAEDLAEALGRLKAALTEEKNKAPVLVRLASLEALTNNSEHAFELLAKAVSLDREAIHWAKGDLAWSQLRTDPRFQALLYKGNAPPRSE